MAVLRLSSLKQRAGMFSAHPDVTAALLVSAARHCPTISNGTTNIPHTTHTCNTHTFVAPLISLCSKAQILCTKIQNPLYQQCTARRWEERQGLVRHTCSIGATERERCEYVYINLYRYTCIYMHVCNCTYICNNAYNNTYILAYESSARFRDNRILLYVIAHFFPSSSTG